MMRKGILFLLILLLSIVARATALSGLVSDESGAPLPFVTISLFSADSALLGGTITRDDGSFGVEVPDNASILRASYMGYRTIETPLVRPIKDYVELVLRVETTVLSEVTIQGRGKLVERRMDKIVMNVAGTPFAIGNNGKDILKKAPGVNIDRKGKITVNGKMVEVYIDGRPSYLSGEQLKTLLEGTDGSTIDRLEIITQPSARYDAAGQGGIINIRTKRNLTHGINGNLSAAYGGMYWRDIQQYMQDDQMSLNLNYRASRTYTSATLTQQYGSRTEVYRSSTTTPEEERETQSRSRSVRQYYSLRLSNDWYVDSVNTLGFMVSVPLSLGEERSMPAYNQSTLWRDQTIVEHNTESRRTDSRWQQHTANINYSHIFTPEQELTVNLDYNRNRSTSAARTQMGYDLPVASDVTIGQDNRHTTDIYSARIDFESAFWQTGKVECGAKWLTTQTGYKSALDTIPSLHSQTSAFRYVEHIGALYLSVGKQFGEHWTTKLGLRGEYSRAIGQWLSADSATTCSYFKLFPSAFVGYMPTPDWTIALDYNRRIQRPSYMMLDPAVQVEDAHGIRVGNTELLPAFTHNMEVSFAYSEYVSLDFSFAYTKDLIDYQTTIQPGGNRVTRAANYGTDNSHGIHLSLTEIPLVPKLSARDEDGHREVTGAWLALTAQIGAMREHTHSYDGLISMRHWMVDVYAELNAYLPRDWTISVDGFYATPSIWGTELLTAWREMNLAVKKEFPTHGITLTARVNDLMLSSRWGSRSLGLEEGYTNSYSGDEYAHQLTVGITWKFGSTLEHRIRNMEETDADRMSVGGKKKR